MWSTDESQRERQGGRRRQCDDDDDSNGIAVVCESHGTGFVGREGG